MLKVFAISLAALLVAGGAWGQEASPKSNERNETAQREYPDWSRFDLANFDPQHTYRFQVGDIRVVIGDHYAHGGTDIPNYTGNPSLVT